MIRSLFVLALLLQLTTPELGSLSGKVTGLQISGSVLFAQDTTVSKLQTEYSQQVQTLLKQYCYECHNAELAEAELDMSVYKSIADIQDSVKATIPAGRYGTPEEFAAVATFFLSAPAGYSTGNLIRVDGGAIKGIW